MEPNQSAERLVGVDSSATRSLDAAIAATHDISAGTAQVTHAIAFEDFYRVYAEPIGRALALTLQDDELAEDALNEAMTRALQKWKRVAHFDNPSGWVYRVAMNWALSWLRRRRRERERPIALSESTTEIAIEDDELRSAIDALSLEHRSVVVCRFFLDWSVQQTAAALEIPAGTVKSRLARALENIRAELALGDEETCA